MAERNSYQLGDGDLTPIGAAFYIVPLVNAITRMGTMSEKEIVFQSMLEWRAYERIPSTKRGCKGQEESKLEQALRVCTNVKNRQTRAKDAGVQEIEDIIAREGLLEHKILVIKLQDIHIERSIVGLVANQFMSKYKRPTMILSPTTHDGKPAWEGSARGYDKSKLKDFRQLVLDSNCAFLAAGHPNAFGCGFYEQDVEEFIAWSDDALKDVEFYPSYRVDFIYSTQTLRARDILELGDAKSLWG